MESDERFKHLASDPRFKTLRKRQRKVQIDERFQSMFTDEKFTLRYSKDKRGRNQKKSSGDDLKRFYSLVDNKGRKEKSEQEQENEESDEVEDEEQENEVDGKDEEKSEVSQTPHDESQTGEVSENDDDETEIDGSISSEAETASEVSSSSDESESEEEADEEGLDDQNEVDVDRIEFDWQPLDHDAETTNESTKRLAIQNLDWDHLDARDIYALIYSIRPPISVKIYVSEFGKERLKQEELEGPKELIEMPMIDEEEKEYRDLKKMMKTLNSKEPKSFAINEYEDADEAMDFKNEEVRERVRRYQLNRMKYYYAVAEFDSVETADVVYKELDGLEYEGSSLELDLRFIPEEMEFDSADLKSECNKNPDPTTYKAPMFINSALQQTTVRFTWDETDVRRQEKLHRAYTKDELEKGDLEAYLASETDSEEEEEDLENDKSNDAVSVVTANSEARINKYKMLLKSLDEEAEKKKKVDVDVVWGDFSGDEKECDSKEVDSDEMDENDDSEPASDDSSMNGMNGEDDSSVTASSIEGSDDEAAPAQTTNARAKGERSRKKRKGKRKDKQARDLAGSDGELDLLVMDTNSRCDDFKFNPDDDRFRAIYESGQYNIDPSHPSFKRTEAFDLIAEKKRSKRQKTRT